ncbi:MAG: hypothetical protein MUC61_03665, partial [Amoebophilaceae bacterium]|nr:hypothetical protein [Amoebophilaceae bacterium]
DQVAHWTGQCEARVLVDSGYRGHGQVGNATVIRPGKQAHENAHALCKSEKSDKIYHAKR